MQPREPITTLSALRTLSVSVVHDSIVRTRSNPDEFDGNYQNSKSIKLTVIRTYRNLLASAYT